MEGRTILSDGVADLDLIEELLLAQGFDCTDLGLIPSSSLSPVFNALDDTETESEQQNELILLGEPSSLGPIVTIKDRLNQALNYIMQSQSHTGREHLVQIWVPTTIGDQQVLTTKGQPFSLDWSCDRLVNYRSISRGFHFSADESCRQGLGLPGRVFVGKVPEWTPDVRLFTKFEYPRVEHAQYHDVRGTIALPIFQRGNRNCLGVVELVTTTRKINYGPEIESICNALQAVDLRTSEVQTIPREKVQPDYSYQSVLPEVQTILKTVCETHKLALAQTWIPCIQQGKYGSRHSDKNYGRCISTVDLACYVRDPAMLPFHQACSEHHLFKGEGVAGRAFLTNQPCFYPDITSFSKIDYPLLHHAKVFDLRAAVAVRLRSASTGRTDFVLEFFLPADCTRIEEQRLMLNSISVMMQSVCRSLRVVTAKEMEEEKGETEQSVIEDPIFIDTNDRFSLGASSSISDDVSSWIASVREAQQKTGVEGFSVTTGGWDNSSQVGSSVNDFLSGFKWNEEFPVKEEDGCGSSLFSGSPGFLNSNLNKGREKRRTKTQKSVSLQDLRKHFAGSLKDAAKSLGVCPTTLKRICRQQGITRWPSRKIKKVGHSLKKLQTVIDSVNGPKGAVQLSSLYENFTKSAWPEKNSSSGNISFSKPKQKEPLESSLNVNNNNNNPLQEGMNSHSSSSCSQSSNSSPVKLEISADENQTFVSKKSLNPVEQTVPISIPQSNNFTNERPESRQDVLKIKVIYGEEKVIFRLLPSWGFQDLKQEVAKRFSIVDPTLFDLKYLDDESEWILLTCDADLLECVDVYKSSSTRTVKISVCPSSSQ